MIGKIKIAILGASSHIAKGLINNFLSSKDFKLYLFSRTQRNVCDFLRSIGISETGCEIHEGYDNFADSSYDAVINCVGVGTARKLQGDYTKYFTVTEEYDNMVLRYLNNNCPGALYISLSSGAVYGRECSVPAEEDSLNCIRVNNIAPEDYYAVVRLNAEAKHRAFKGLKIVDLRIFSYFSRFADLADGYFITDIIDCIMNNKILITDGADMVRDYLHPDDLFSMIVKCINAGGINAAFDVVSARPVKKKEIIEYFFSQYGLRYKIEQALGEDSATGFKSVYYSNYRSAEKIGYSPKFSSKDTIIQESNCILKSKNV
ncbi:MAG: NAD(P)-dependent oxidoreductase [Nitrospirae bacterium]|nr:NAD(P)-dependent oxidoreductase [Nitrospirota bacterium]